MIRRAAVLLAALGALVAQEPAERTVAVTVTGASERSVYLDHGRDLGLMVGGTVVLWPPGGDRLEVEIRSVSQTSARAEVPPGVDLPPVGTRGEAVVPVVAAATPQGRRPAPPPPVEHPPWTRREAPRSNDQPLLVPTYGQRPEQRPVAFDGRAWLSSQWWDDAGDDRQRGMLLSRLGTRFDVTNGLGLGERLRFAGEVDDRRVWLDDAPDETDQAGRLDLLSVAFGTAAWAADGVELGRFWSPHLPEIGLVDGVEYVRRLQGGLRCGLGLGAYPRPFPARATGDDLGVHAFVDWIADERRSAALALGVQKTWHRGAPDRDVLLLRGEARPTERTVLFGSGKVDFYSGSDTIEERGAELTEAMLQARYDDTAWGTGLTASHFGWPELKRAEYQFLDAELIRNGTLDRLSWQGWWRPAAPLRVGARLDHWWDPAREGTSGGVDLGVTDWLGAGSHLLVSAFLTDGATTAGPGGRLTYRAPLLGGHWSLGARWHRYDVQGLASGDETYVRQSVELGWACPIGLHGDLDLRAERWFGDRENALALSLFLQWRF